MKITRNDEKRIMVWAVLVFTRGPPGTELTRSTVISQIYHEFRSKIWIKRKKALATGAARKDLKNSMPTGRVNPSLRQREMLAFAFREISSSLLRCSENFLAR